MGTTEPLKRRETPRQTWGNGAVVVTRTYPPIPLRFSLRFFVALSFRSNPIGHDSSATV
jgi:hypothetical protein